MRAGETVRIGPIELDADAARLLHARLNETRSRVADLLTKATHERIVQPLTIEALALGALSAAIYRELSRPEVVAELERRRRARPGR